MVSPVYYIIGVMLITLLVFQSVSELKNFSMHGFCLALYLYYFVTGSVWVISPTIMIQILHTVPHTDALLQTVINRSEQEMWLKCAVFRPCDIMQLKC